MMFKVHGFISKFLAAACRGDFGKRHSSHFARVKTVLIAVIGSVEQMD